MTEHVGRLTATVLIDVGAAFDFHSGLKKQAPCWMQRSGLEWLFRLARTYRVSMAWPEQGEQMRSPVDPTLISCPPLTLRLRAHSRRRTRS
jgi:hypothetical protein